MLFFMSGEELRFKVYVINRINPNSYKFLCVYSRFWFSFSLFKKKTQQVFCFELVFVVGRLNITQPTIIQKTGGFF